MDIVILTPISLEYEYACKLLVNKEEEKKENFIYVVGDFQGGHHRYRIAIRESGSRLENIALAAEKAIQHFQPSMIILLGIAGGVKDVAIGDVVVGEKAYGYETGKEDEDGFRVRPESIAYDADLIEFLKSVNYRGEWKKGLSNPSPQAYFGPIASGNKVIATDSGFVSKLLKSSYNDTIALEMEGIGFAKAVTRYRNVRSLNIRGISDLLSGKKASDQAGNQEKAMLNVLAFVRAFLFDLKFSDYQLITMEPKKLAGAIVDNLFPQLKVDSNQVTLAPEASGALQNLWKEVATIIAEEVAAEDSLPDAKVAARSSLRKVLTNDDKLFERLAAQIMALSKNDAAREAVRIVRSKNVIQGSNITVGGNFHLGDKNGANGRG